MICSQKPKPKPGCTRLGTVSQRRVVLVRQMPLRGDVSLPTCSVILCLSLFWSCSSRCSSVVHVSRGIPSPFSSRMKAPAKHMFWSFFYKPMSAHDLWLPAERFLQPRAVVPALSTQLWPPPQACQCFGSQVICSSVLLKGWGCELPLFVFPGKEMRR